ncbi:hypothetical protein CV102_01155 [Natronococcus pandeyae]|uniref:Uncharacterized protein n=1 Tax=Natronococcus pandeyae TaxID=2055836 RepID=A0A8J8Q4I7_9EURY|nr:hypothetical protein [Natronococcus pandeyae]TYL40220.1 hypothetical protein CV102_01155 [Natronococcus pandeyae]
MNRDELVQYLDLEGDEVVMRLNLIITLLLIILFLLIYPIIGVYLGLIIVAFFTIVALEISREE